MGGVLLMSTIFSLECNDVDQLNISVKDANLEHYQVSKGDLVGKLTQIDLGETTICTGAYNQKLIAKGTFAKDVITFASLMDAEEGKTIFRSHVIPNNSTLCLSENSEMSYAIVPDSTWSTFTIERSELEHLGFDITRLADSYAGSVHQPISQISTLLHDLKSLTPQELIYLDKTLVYEQFLSAYLDSFSHTDRVVKLEKDTYKKVASQVYEYIKTQSSTAIMMHELCTLTGRSERTLQRSFKAHYNVTIQEFIKSFRLHEVHKALVNPANRETISMLALRHGFTHLGRFSQEYKSFFRESPSETSNKSKIFLK